MRQWSLGSWAYEWNANGSLKKVKCPDGKEVTFTYDALGRRTKKVANGKIKRYLWDGNVLLHEWEYNAADEPQLLVSPIGEVTFDKEEPIENLITWVYENGSFVPIGKLTDNEGFSVVSDYLGTPVQAYDQSGNLIWERELDIYGRVRKLKGDKDFCNFLYQGQYYDKETELAYNRFRYYDCNTGTYISKDPIGLAGGLALYGYVKDVNKFVDIFGLTGTYIFVFDTGNYYIGKGSIDRAGDSQNIRTNEVKVKNNGISPTIIQGAHIDWGDDKIGFLVEQELINRKGAVQDPMGLNRINQPGAKPLEEMKINDPNAYADIVKKADELEAKLAKSTGKIKCK
ncbi:MAG: RHS repeat-associated core domain-containing protein [Bacteroidota bacterium]|nr:RHS repeat-associated core domain-containing protein [Bacteroidota bacterium]